MREYQAEPYDAARLAAIAQVSLRILQEAFRKHVGMSPMAYVTEVRLQRVRMQLRTSPQCTVTDVAYQWGSHIWVGSRSATGPGSGDPPRLCGPLTSGVPHPTAQCRYCRCWAVGFRYPRFPDSAAQYGALPTATAS
ncbi:helix-turn-helix transcriptional regulator [Streptomyces sp. M19]